MCSVCGCGQPSAGPHHPAHDDDHHHGHGHPHDHDHPHDHGHSHGNGHDHFHEHEHGHAHDHGGALGAVHAPGVSRSRIVEVERNLLEANDRFAAGNRRYFADRGIFALNLVSSPGSGKTTLLVRTIELLKSRMPVTVIEGDQQTALDAERILTTGVPAVQINTGRGCHLDAHMVGHAVERLAPVEGSVLFIENVGNLVCPAGFDLGEAHKVVLLSVTEGDDKPLKYPDMFAAADLMVVTKLDLLPFVAFEVERCIDHARRVNPGIQVIKLSALGGEGLVAWLDWIEQGQRGTLRAAGVDRSAEVLA